MAGGVSSLNVSAAGAVVLYEAARQRRAAAETSTTHVQEAAPRSATPRSGDAKVEPRVQAAKTERSRFMKATRSVPHPFAGFLAKGWETTRATHLILATVFFLVALPATTQSTPAAPQNPPQPDEPHHGQVIFSRSTDENGQTTTTVGPGAQQPAPTGQSVEAPTASDAEREALTFTDFDMDVHLRPAEHAHRRARPRHRAQRRQIPARPHPAPNFFFAELGAHSPRRDATLSTPSPRSTPTPTTPASFTRPPSHSPLRSRPAQPCSSTSPTPAPSRNRRSACLPSARRRMLRCTPIGTRSTPISPACAASATWSGTPPPASP